MMQMVSLLIMFDGKQYEVQTGFMFLLSFILCVYSLNINSNEDLYKLNTFHNDIVPKDCLLKDARSIVECGLICTLTDNQCLSFVFNKDNATCNICQDAMPVAIRADMILGNRLYQQHHIIPPDDTTTTRIVPPDDTTTTGIVSPDDTTTTGIACPKGYTFDAGTPLCFGLHANTGSYAEAEYYCSQKGERLIVLDTDTKFQNAGVMIKSRLPDTGIRVAGKFDTTSGSWKFPNGQVLDNSFFKLPALPITTKCAHIKTDDTVRTYNMYFNDCDTLMRILCEVPLS